MYLRTNLAGTLYVVRWDGKTPSPLGEYFSIIKRWALNYHQLKLVVVEMERETRLELATPTLARLCSTN